MGELAGLLEEFRNRTGVPAVAGALVGRDDNLVVDVVGSRRRAPDSEPATVDDVWHIGSCGKAMTAVLYARLVEAGLTQWGVPVRDLFADLAGSVDPGWSEPTVDDLLRCRAGAAANPSKAEMSASWTSSSSPRDQRTRSARSVLAVAPKQPGRFRYSNLGYAVVGAAIDRLAGVPYEEALRVHVLEPLNITSLGLGPPSRVHGHGPRVQVGPLVFGKGAPAPPGDIRSDNPPLLTPAGRMHLTMADWASFQRVFLNEGRPLLSADALRHLLVIPDHGRRTMAMGWASAAGLGGSYGMQGSNARWAATAIIDANCARTAIIVANDGRTRILRRSARLAGAMLQLPREESGCDRTR